MIDIRTDRKGGPGIFLSRLEEELKKKGSSVINRKNIVLSNDYVKTKDIFISRVDGIHFLKMSPIEFSTFLYFRAKNKYKFLSKVIQILDSSIGSKFDRYLTPKLTEFFFHRMNNLKLKSIAASDFIIYQSNFSRDMYKIFCKNYGQDKHTIIYNGVNIEDFSPNKRNLNLSRKLGINANLKIVFSGSIRPFKRVHEIIKLLPLVKKYIPGTRFYILGDSDKQSKIFINKLINKNNLHDEVVFLGKIEPERLPLYYSNMDIMIHASWFDACPNTVIEALSCGVPVICPNIGGTPELVGNGGIIVDENFQYEFKEYYNFKKIPKIGYTKYVQAILEIFNNKDKYSALARKRAVENFDIKNVATEYIEVFKKFNYKSTND